MRRRHCMIALVALCAGCAGASHHPGTEAALKAWRAGDAAGAAAAWKALAEAEPGRAGTWRSAAAAAHRAGLDADALACRRAALAADPPDRWSALVAARLLMAAGKPEEALSVLPPGASEGQLVPWERLTRAQALRRAGRPEEALAEAQGASSAGYRFAPAEQERAEILAGLGRDKEALQAYSTALSWDPSMTHLNRRVAELEARLGKAAAAYERLRRLLLVDSGNQEAKDARDKLAKADPKLAEGEKKAEKGREDAWLAFSAPVASPLPPVPLEPVAVGVVQGSSDFRLKCSSAAGVSTAGIAAGNACLGLVPPQSEVAGTVRDGLLRLSWNGGATLTAQPVRFDPEDPSATVALFKVHFEKGFYWSNEENRVYRGSMEARLGSDGLIALVNRVSLEEYLLGVVPSEVPDEWPREALRAQAVAARTETLRKINRHRADGFNVCATQHCAVYKGLTGEKPRSSGAVAATRGEVIRYRGEYVDCVYAANCGGWGSSAAAVWGSAGAADPEALPAVCDLKPLAAVEWRDLADDPDVAERFLFERPEAWCNHESYRASFRWARSYTLDEFSGWVDRRLGTGPLARAAAKSWTPEGWLTEMEFEGGKGKKSAKRDAVRGALFVARSNHAVVDILPACGNVPPQVFVVGAGWGHGAGMCQDGVLGLANAGRTYRDILAHYYRGASRETLYK